MGGEIPAQPKPRRGAQCLSVPPHLTAGPRIWEDYKCTLYFQTGGQKAHNENTLRNKTFKAPPLPHPAPAKQQRACATRHPRQAGHGTWVLNLAFSARAAGAETLSGQEAFTPLFSTICRDKCFFWN